MTRAFGSGDELSAADLADAPVRYPRPSTLDAPLPAPHEKAAQALERLGLETIGDLLDHLPRDRREGRTVATLVPGEAATVVVEVRSIRSRSVRRRGMRPLVEATVADETGPMKVTFFNQPWLEQKYRPGTRLVLHGKYKGRNAFTVQSHAPTSEELAGEGDVAHYPASEGIDSTQILELVREHRAEIADTLEPLPAKVRTQERLPDRPASLDAMHFPNADHDAATARERLAFDEMLLLELVMLRRKARRQNTSAPALDGPETLTRRWRDDALPFTPTHDQTHAIDTVFEDMAHGRPMQRLLMGEVGSGKTVVALAAMLRAVENGMQAALMAPTETLADQHFATIQRLLGGESVSAALLTGSTPATRRAGTLSKLATGELQVLVGTHALIEDSVAFDRLAVAVVDEQHRFGVDQRRRLDRKAEGSRMGGLRPHMLFLTATPIPRTLALTAYGDLDTTALKELPSGRKPVETHVAGSDRERARAYERIREEVRAGRQAFVVCPLVEESEALQARAATAEYERLKRTELADFEVVLLHGQMRPRAKQEAMAAFAEGQADVLVATSVIEVGIDVPNATVMLVENAERYGISQLHQLRGRVGRGEHESVCIIFGPGDSQRLRALAEHHDGFRLAEIDLELRGEGEIVGTRQHGAAEFRVARLPEDAALLDRARVHARAMLHDDPELETPEHALVALALRRAYGAEALEPIPA
ncbi:MAG: ATP-dependent helicase RecG [Solirubrobacteraceae bacterium]|nr:ATP-dependent helicase RecG [Solirubrobacteraceae bacterium]